MHAWLCTGLLAACQSGNAGSPEGDAVAQAGVLGAHDPEKQTATADARLDLNSLPATRNDAAFTPRLPTRLPLSSSLNLRKHLELMRMELTKGVADREPLAITEPFYQDERAMVFLELGNLGKQVRELSVIWRAPQPHPPHDPIRVRIPLGERHRTWAYSLPLAHLGTWTCELRNDRGKLLSTLDFVVEERP